jgi:hypothetical protein
LGSLKTLTAQPLPLDVLGQISIMCHFIDSVRKARTFFTDAFPGPEIQAEDWQSCGFRSRSHLLRDVMVPIAVTQTLGAAHFLQWIVVGLRKTLSPHWIEPSNFEAGDLSAYCTSHLFLFQIVSGTLRHGHTIKHGHDLSLDRPDSLSD